MTHPLDIPLCESFDDFAWDPQEVSDLIQTSPHRFDEDDLTTRYDAEQCFGMEAASITRRSL